MEEKMRGVEAKWSAVDEVQSSDTAEDTKVEFQSVTGLLDAIASQHKYQAQAYNLAISRVMDKTTLAAYNAASAMEKASLAISVEAATGKWQIVWPYLEEIKERNAELSELCGDAWNRSVSRACLSSV